jgi:diaminopimelate epimerase
MQPPAGFRKLSDTTCQIDTGSPHYVHFQKKDEGPLAGFDVFSMGKSIRYSETYRSEGINVNFVNAFSPSKIEVRTYERGVEDETLSCGTGVTACAYAHLLMNGGEDHIEVDTPGGKLKVEVLYAGSDKEEVFLCGPATFVFTGELALSV